MFGGLAGGVLLALGHHLFYHSLQGKPVESNVTLFHRFSKQETDTILGTLFAFLVKAFLALAVSTAYTQLVWKTVKKREMTLASLDTMFSILGNVLAFLKVSVWWKYPFLLLLALTVW